MAKLQELDRLVFKQDLVEAVNIGYVGSKWDKKGLNARQLGSYRRELNRKINRLLNRGRQTLWEKLTRKSRVL